MEKLSTPTNKAFNQIYVINLYSYIALIAATTFGSLHFLELFVDINKTVGAIELSVGAIVLANMLALRLHGNILVARSILLAAILVLLEVLLVSGGTQNTGVFWLFAFPVATFFMAGKKQGIWWVVFFYTVIIGTIVAAQTPLFDIPYSRREMYQLLISLSVVTFGVYIYQMAREKAHSAVEESHRDLQEFLDQMTTYNLKVGVDGVVLFANKTAKESSGLGDNIIGSKFLDGRAWTANETARKRTENAFHEAASGKRVTYDEQVNISTADGQKQLVVSFSLVPVFKDDRIRYVLVEARDVTKEREAARTKNEFVSNATSQLRPSISAISESTSELRKLAGQLPGNVQEQVQKIHHNNQQINRVVSNMLLVSGLELGNLPVNPQKLDLAALSGSVVEAVKTVFLKGRELTIEEDYSNNLPSVEVDFELTSTIISDLLTNAIKSTKDGGEIHIRINKTDQKLTPDSAGSIQIEVQDNGHGIPEIEQKKIFTKFFRTKNPDSQSGSGQSLYIIKKLLDYVGGTVTFMSKENVGSIFVVIIPLEGMRASNAPTITNSPR